MKYKILLVDDNKSIRSRYKNIFLNNGFDVIEADNGLEGANKALEENINLIMTGIIMPKMDGFDLIRQLRENIKTSNIPVIMISHIGRKEDQVKASEMGIKDFFQEGFITPLEIVRLVRFRLGDNKINKKYAIDINEGKMDTQKLIEDFSLEPSLKCGKHPHEKLVLLMSVDSENPGYFKAKFVCPQEINK